MNQPTCGIFDNLRDTGGDTAWFNLPVGYLITYGIVGDTPWFDILMGYLIT